MDNGQKGTSQNVESLNKKQCDSASGLNVGLLVDRGEDGQTKSGQTAEEARRNSQLGASKLVSCSQSSGSLSSKPATVGRQTTPRSDEIAGMVQLEQIKYQMVQEINAAAPDVQYLLLQQLDQRAAERLQQIKAGQQLIPQLVPAGMSAASMNLNSSFDAVPVIQTMGGARAPFSSVVPVGTPLPVLLQHHHHNLSNVSNLGGMQLVGIGSSSSSSSGTAPRSQSSTCSVHSVRSSSSSGNGLGGETEMDRASHVGCGGSIVSTTEAGLRSSFHGLVSKHPLPVIYHKDFRGHTTRIQGTGEVHQEAPERVHNIFLRLHEDPKCHEHIKMMFDSEMVPLASREQLTQVHDEEYVRFLEGLCVRYDAGPNSELPSDHEVLRFSPLVVSRLFDNDLKKRYFGEGRYKDSGTRFSPGSYKAALRSAGAVVRGVEIVMNEEIPQKRCFCLVRPPGHHAGPRGFDPIAGGCGFCLVNNVMVGAAEALRCFPGCKVAIVDIDVHHGNGTQNIILKRFKDDKRLLFCSVHLHETFPGDPDMDFFPGTGAEIDSDQILNVPIVPLWAAVSAPAVAEQAEAAARSGSKRKKTKSARAASSKAIKRLKADSIAGSSKSSPMQPFPHPGDQPNGPVRGRHAFRRAIEHRVLPRLKQFKPDLIIMSTGFDAAFEDQGNTVPEGGGMDLTEGDFAWATDLIVNQGGADRIVSVLEGGYGKWSEKLDMFDQTSLINCAMSHLASLVERPTAVQSPLPNDQ